MVPADGGAHPAAGPGRVSSAWLISRDQGGGRRAPARAAARPAATASGDVFAGRAAAQQPGIPRRGPDRHGDDDSGQGTASGPNRSTHGIGVDPARRGKPRAALHPPGSAGTPAPWPAWPSPHPPRRPAARAGQGRPARAGAGAGPARTGQDDRLRSACRRRAIASPDDRQRGQCGQDGQHVPAGDLRPDGGPASRPRRSPDRRRCRCRASGTGCRSRPARQRLLLETGRSRPRQQRRALADRRGQSGGSRRGRSAGWRRRGNRSQRRRYRTTRSTGRSDRRWIGRVRRAAEPGCSAAGAEHRTDPHVVVLGQREGRQHLARLRPVRHPAGQQRDTIRGSCGAAPR